MLSTWQEAAGAIFKVFIWYDLAGIQTHNLSCPLKDFQAGPILQICIHVMMALHQKWLNEQEKHLFVLISKFWQSQIANTLSQNRDMGA